MRISNDVVTFSIVGAGARSTNYVKIVPARSSEKQRRV
jgi:hypothetical protein